MKKSVVFLAFILSIFLASAEPCDPTTMLDICYNSFPINSQDGFGAAEICGVCYQCGEADGVCPELFLDPITNQRGNCNACNDPDCNATITGFVRQAGYEPPDSGPNIAGARVTATPLNPLVPSVTVETNPSGHYEMENAPSGRITLSAAKVGFDTEIIELTLLAGNDYTQDFYLPNASCDMNCSNYFGRCNRDCHGINDCDFADWSDTGYLHGGIDYGGLDQSGFSYFAQICHERKLGDWVVIGENQNTITSMQCCEGFDIRVENRPRSIATGEMKNLMVTTIPALFRGEGVLINIATW